MSTSADVIVVGAGHNGLVAACYLARAGRKVLVLEASETFGGMTSTNIVFPEAPQHRINEGGMDVTLLRASSIIADLELERHGFAQIEVDPPYAFLHPHGSSLCIWRDPQKTADEIRHFSKSDAAAYLEFANSIDLMMNLVLPYMRSHPTRIDVCALFVGFLKMLRHPRRLWGLNRFISASHAEYLEENFEHPMVRGPLAAIPPFLPIQTEGTAWMLVYFGLIHRIGVSRVKSGTGGLTDALASSLRASHGTIRTGARVESILVEHNRAVGVRLVGGEELRAKTVVTACNVRYALQDLVPAGSLTRSEVAQTHRIPIAASRATSFKIDFALNAPIKLSKHQAWRKDGVDLRKPGLCWVNYEQHVSAWDACAAGRLPNPLPSFVLLPTAIDPTQAPAGQDTLWYWSGIAPSHPTESWATLKERATREVLSDMSQYFDDVEGIEIARRVMSPDDIAERFTVPHGNVYHVDTGVSRFGPFRPAEKFSGFTTSIDGLFLSGGGMHPSSGIAGIPGAAHGQDRAAQNSLMRRPFMNTPYPKRSSFPRRRESSPSAPTSLGMAGKNWMPAPRLQHSGAGPAGMTFPFLGVALLALSFAITAGAQETPETATSTEAEASADAPPAPALDTIPVTSTEQAPAADPAAPASRSRLVEEIVVTAQKREENLQDVPISIAAFSAESLDARGAFDTKALAQITPAVSITEFGGFSFIFIRGIGSDAFVPSADPSVTTYVDGIFVPTSQGFSTDFGGVERVEVLKGSQGTLFGRNSTGGAINVITKKPGGEFEGSLQGTTGNYDERRLKAYLNVPVLDSLAFSFRRPALHGGKARAHGVLVRGSWSRGAAGHSGRPSRCVHRFGVAR